jgi:hypothetical protein
LKLHFMHPAIGELAIPLERDSRVVIGRHGAGASIELNWDHRISRKHATVTAVAGEVWFEDLGSANGSWVGEARVDGKVRFEPGMSILVGRTVVTLTPDEQTDDPWAVSTDTDVMGGPTSPTPVLAFETDDMTTKELEAASHEVEAAIQALGPSIEQHSPARASFTSNTQVTLRLPSREAFRRFWFEDLRKTGLFVETPEPPAFGTKLELVIQTPDGLTAIPATVVHVITPATASQFGMPSGAGLQAAELDPEHVRQIERYAHGESELLDVEAHSLPTAEVEEQLAKAQLLLENIESGTLYAALMVDPSADQQAIGERLDVLQRLFSQRSSLRPPQVARLDAALRSLARVRAVLMDQHQRLVYDFRAGHHRIQDRLKRAREGTGPSLPELRNAWNVAMPASVEQSAGLMRKAFAAHQSHDLAGAIEHARRAVELNPFFGQLEAHISLWEKQAAKSPKGR